jgi:hypothetical protein
VIDEAELRRMSPQERASLMRSLAALDTPLLTSPAVRRRRRLFLIALIICCVVLAVQIGVLAWTLPRYYRTGNWRGAWVGFDVGLFCTFAVTAWAAWRGRQLLIMCLVVLATLLTTDAWFDVTLDAQTSGFLVSLLSALLVELPLAAIAIMGARRLLRLTIRQVMHREGLPGPVPPLWRIPLFGPGEGHLGRHPDEKDRDEEPAAGRA